MNKVLWKDNLKEIKKTWPRFLSILLISLLGVAFYVGIRATSPSMIQTAQTYYQTYSLPAGSLQSTLGLNDEDLKILRSEGLRVEGLKTLEVTLQPQAERIKLYPYQNQAYFYAVEGRLPQKQDEIALDIRYQNKETKLGDWVSLEGQEVEADESVSTTVQGSYLKERRVRVVGFADTSLYYSKISRGVTNISGFGLLHPDAIGGDIYTEAYYWLHGAGPFLAYSDQYNEAINRVNQVLEAKLESQAPQRLTNLKKEGESQLSQAQDKVDQGYQDLKEAEAKLDEAEDKLAQGQADYEAGIAEIRGNEAKLVEGQILLVQGQNQLDASKAQIQEERQLLQDKEAEYENGLLAYKEGKRQLQEGLNQGEDRLAKSWEDLLAGKESLDQHYLALEEGKKALSEGQDRLTQEQNQIYDQLSQQIPNLNQALQDLVEGAKSQANPSQEEIAIIKAGEEKDQLTLILAYLGQEASRLADQLNVINEQVDKGSIQLAELQARLDQLENQASANDSLTESISQVREDTLADEIKAAQAQVENLVTSLQETEIERDQAETYYQTLLSQLENLSRVEPEGQEGDETANSISTDPSQEVMEAAKNQAYQEYQNQVLAYATLQEQVDQAKVLLDNLKNQQENMSLSPSQDESQSQDIQGQIEELKSQIASLESQIANGQASQQVLQEALSHLEGQSTSLKVAKETLEKEASKLALASQEITNGQARYDEGVKIYEDGLSRYQVGQMQLATQAQVGQTQLDASLSLLNEGRSQLDMGWLALSRGLSQIQTGQTQLDQEAAKLAEGQAALIRGQQDLDQALKDLEAGRLEYEEGLNQFEQNHVQALEDLKEAQAQIDKAKQGLEKLETPQYYLRDRSGFDAYDTLYDNAQQIYEISQIFPLFFFAIALLVIFTTIRRMVSEQRNYLGTMKQMGYSNWAIILKFVTYAGLAALLGLIFGVDLGYRVFPAVIMNSYNNLFHFDQIEVVRSWQLNGMVAVIILACALVPAIWTPFRMLRSQPARLLQPEPPKAGKKILLESLPFIWKCLGFNKKMTIRNLLRYKGRNAMTLVGVAGCTMLIVTGFGISDTIAGLVDTQFNQLHTYDALVQFKDNTDEQVQVQVAQTQGIEASLPIHQTTWQTHLDDLADQGVNVMVPLNQVDGYIHLANRDAHQILNLEEGVVITERLAEYAGVKEGDVLELEKDGRLVQIPIKAITENYIGHYLYLSEKDYIQYFGEEAAANAHLLKYQEGSNPLEIENKLSNYDSVQAVVTLGNLMTNVQKTMDSLDLITLVLVVSAALLAFIVLYNLTNINISERLRELSTIKVLGFYNREVSLYIFDEILILTGLGAFVGLGLGSMLNTYLLKTIQMPNLFFYPQVSIKSYLISFVMTFIFTSLVMVFMHGKISKIDMVEALKAIE